MKLMLTVLCFVLTMSSAFAFNKKQLLKMSDKKLWKAGISKKIGSCVISDARTCENCACDYYLKSTKEGLAEGGGLPHGYGTGCLVAPSLNKGRATCWSAPNVYDQYNDSKTPICTDNYIKNGANMLRIGIKKGLCDV